MKKRTEKTNKKERERIASGLYDCCWYEPPCENLCCGGVCCSS